MPVPVTAIDCSWRLLPPLPHPNVADRSNETGKVAIIIIGARDFAMVSSAQFEPRDFGAGCLGKQGFSQTEGPLWLQPVRGVT